MNRIAIVEDDQGYRDTLFTYIKQYEQERDTAFEATPFEKADDFLAVADPFQTHLFQPLCGLL